MEEHKRKPIHGQLCWNCERLSVDKDKSLAWSCGSGLKGETDSLIIAVQDKALHMHYHQMDIM
jgi:hypothetical protein